ncbi:MAG: B12-binding domain-containing radical SAM protein [Nitrospinae bacterium]|nr:B12-binding domain-containing radical SAM protein [Nitrospinota bacterium]
MDLMLIVSPANARSSYMPFYYLYLAGYMEKHGISVTIVDPHFKNDGENVEYILNQVKSVKPRFVGLACFVTDYTVVIDLAARIRAVSDAKILMGNAQPSIAPQDFLYAGSPVDIVVRGEGEETVREIIASNNSIPLSDIDGIAYFDGTSAVVTKKRKLIDMADCGKPAYHLLDMDWYSRPTRHIIRRLATVCAVIYTGRGCPFDCSFCASNTVWRTNDRAGGSFVRRRPLEHVMAELTLLQNKYGFDFFYILDDTFGVREQDILDFCAEYKKSGLTMLWGAESRAPCIKNPDVVKILREAGCIQLDFGVESGSQKLLDGINKKMKVEQIIHAFDLCRGAGIRTFANMLLNLPQEDEEDLKLSHQLLERIRPTYVSVGVTQPYPGTDIYNSFGKTIEKEEYHLFSRLLPPEKFRMATHQRDLQTLLYQWLFKYKVFGLVEGSMFSAGSDYWRKLVSSKFRGKYFLYFVRTFVETLVIYARALRDSRSFGAK